MLGLDLKSSGFFSVLPWVTMAISANVGGWIADTLVERGWSVTSVRKIMQTVRRKGARVGSSAASRTSPAGRCRGQAGASTSLLLVTS